MRCSKCGAEGSGKFCSQCGAPMKGEKSAGRCAKCGGDLDAGAMFCGQCGQPTGHRPSKGKTAYLPWVLSALALVAFAIAITMFIQGQTSQRVGDMPITGALPEAERMEPSGAGPGAVDLNSMTPRQAADRLFDRVMRTDEVGNTAEAQQFATMAVQAYEMLPESEQDADARFHLGLLHLVLEDPDAAEREADLILSLESEHLLALAVKARAAERRGDEAARVEAYGRFLDALPAGLASGKPEYQMHDAMLEAEAVRAREVTGRD